MSEGYALITGGTSGIGFEIAKKLSKRNVNLFLVYLSDDNKAENARSELLKLNSKIKVHIEKTDLSNISLIDPLVKKIRETYLDKDLLYFISCHGRIRSSLFIQKKIENILEVLNEHLMSNVVLTHSLLNTMCLNKFGRVIFLTSLAAHKINQGQCDYALAKSGLETFVMSLTSEYSHRNITFNCISAGLVDTRARADIVEDINKQGRSKVVKAGEVASLALYLLSEEACAITGSTLRIDAGQFCHGNNLDYHRLSFQAKSST